jgi:sarcosine oxidase
VYQAQSGLVTAARANAAHVRLARGNGATVHESAPVRSIRSEGGEVHVRTDDMNVRCGRLLITAGPWSNHALAHLGIRLPLSVTKEQITYFVPTRPELFTPERFPIWIWMDDPCFYGIPTYGEAGPKVGQDAGGQEVDPDRRTFDVDRDALGRVEAFLRRYIPGTLGSIIYTKTCLYTLTPDRDFVIDRVPGHPNVFVAIGAGHAFKFASLIGQILSELAVDGGMTPSDISAFGIERPILQLADPPKTYMV